jgi:hypothetical protein
MRSRLGCPVGDGGTVEITSLGLSAVGSLGSHSRVWDADIVVLDSTGWYDITLLRLDTTTSHT